MERSSLDEELDASTRVIRRIIGIHCGKDLSGYNKSLGCTENRRIDSQRRAAGLVIWSGMRMNYQFSGICVKRIEDQAAHLETVSDMRR